MLALCSLHCYLLFLSCPAFMHYILDLYNSFLDWFFCLCFNFAQAHLKHIIQLYYQGEFLFFQLYVEMPAGSMFHRKGFYCGGKSKLRLDLSYRFVPPSLEATASTQTCDILIFILCRQCICCHFMPVSFVPSNTHDNGTT